MKSDSKNLTRFPKARYVVTATGVKMIGFNNRDIRVLKISEQQRQYLLWDIIMKHGFGKRYV